MSKTAEAPRSPKELQNLVIQQIEEIGHKNGRNGDRVFADWVNMSACALSAGTREEEYLQTIKPYKRESLDDLCNLFGLFVRYYEPFTFEDVLGPIHMELGSARSKKHGGEFYTPTAISKLMAQMVITKDSIKPTEIFKFQEPACGAGGMVLAAAEKLVELGFSVLNMQATCIDVSPLACDMCFVQLSLWGIPAIVILGNSLTMELRADFRTPTYHMAVPPCGDMAYKILEFIRATKDKPNEDIPKHNTEETSKTLLVSGIEKPYLGQGNLFGGDL